MISKELADASWPGDVTSQVLLGVGHKAMGVKLFLVGRTFLARGEYFWLGGTLATFGAVFSRAPYRITRWPRGFGGNPRQKCAAGENWRK